MDKMYYILILALLLTSCASPIALSDVSAVPQGESIVFGRVDFGLWGGNEILWLFILPEGASKAVTYKLFVEDGPAFQWHLPSGRYTIVGFQWGTDEKYWKPRYRIGHRRIFAHFIIPDDTSIVYIGTLKIGSDSLRVEDEYKWELPKFKREFPEVAGKVTTSLMQLEKPR